MRQTGWRYCTGSEVTGHVRGEQEVRSEVKWDGAIISEARLDAMLGVNRKFLLFQQEGRSKVNRKCICVCFLMWALWFGLRI